MNNTCDLETADWLARPLCCSYVYVHFNRLPVSVQHGCDAFRAVQHWGFGTLEDGQWEVFGLRPTSDVGVAAWRGFANQLRSRGVERMRVVVGADSGGIAAAIQRWFPGAISLPDSVRGRLIAPDQSEYFLAVPGWHQRLHRQANDLANRLSHRLERAVARHGRFRTVAAASKFVFDRLVCEERQHDRSELARAAAVHRSKHAQGLVVPL